MKHLRLAIRNGLPLATSFSSPLHSTGAARSAENEDGNPVVDHDRILREAALDRERAQGELLAAIFTLPSRIGSWRPRRRDPSAQAAPAGVTPPRRRP